MAYDLSRSFVRVQPNGCWNWARATAKGHGRIYYRGRLWQAHRLFCQLAHGEVPKDHAVDHLCCNPLCVNPAHLEAVTHQENMKRHSQRYHRLLAYHEVEPRQAERGL
jgi:hypothetical protein